MPGGPSQDPRFASRPRKPMISSSMPSAANRGVNAGSPATPAPAAACCASTRWIAVSCACRRAQNASGVGASRNVQQVMPGSAASSARTSAAWPSRNQPASASSPGPPLRISASGARLHPPGMLLPYVPGGPAVHIAEVLEQVAHAPAGAGRDQGIEAGLLSSACEQLAFRPQARDVVGDVAGTVLHCAHAAQHGPARPPTGTTRAAVRLRAPGEAHAFPARSALRPWD